ncbi:MAG: ferrochelatase [Thermoanaerobaculia bacterium]
MLLMAYGGPGSLDEVEPFLLDVRGGRETPGELVEEVTARYRAIGGGSPILERSREQARALEGELARGGGEWRVFVGMRHWHPYIRQAVGEIVAEGFDELVALCLTPQESSMSVGAYFRELDRALDRALDGALEGARLAGAAEAGATEPHPALAEGPGARTTGSPPALRRIRSWHDHPGFVDAVAARVEEALRRFPGPGSPGRPHEPEVQVVFTAHSLPESILKEGDPYDRQVRETAARVAERVAARTGRALPWQVAYQSAGARAVPWLGPSLDETLRRLASEGGSAVDSTVSREGSPEGRPAVLVAPVGFVSDHVEILYDLDVEAREEARELGVRLERTASLNDSPDFIAALADLVRSALR